MSLALFEEAPPEYELSLMEDLDSADGTGLRAVGSFSGCGGSTLGMKLAGWNVEAAVEFIPAAAETYRANFPFTQLLERDVRKVTPEEILNLLGLSEGELDCFEGSPPCASFSSAGSGSKHWGKEKKYSDSKQRTDDLFFEWLRILRGLMPRTFIAENVPGMLTTKALGEYTHRITKLLGECGYRVTARVLNAASYGVPQERRRLIFVGVRMDVPGEFVWPAPTTPVPHTLRQALAVAGESSAEVLAGSSMEGYAVGRTWEWKKGLRRKEDCARCGEPIGAHVMVAKRVKSVPKTAALEPDDEMQLGEMGKASAAPVDRESYDIQCADGKVGIMVKDYFLLRVPDLDAPCPTVTATGSEPGAASVTHPTECRKFTPEEVKAICGFPADFVLTGSRSQQYERMGRAVPPPLYAAVSAALAEVLL